MQFCNINNKIIDYVFDKSKLKTECFTPGLKLRLKSNDIKKTKFIIYYYYLGILKEEIIKQEKILLKMVENLLYLFHHQKL